MHKIRNKLIAVILCYVLLWENYTTSHRMDGLEFHLQGLEMQEVRQKKERSTQRAQEQCNFDNPRLCLLCTA